MADSEYQGPEAVIVLGTPSGGQGCDEYMQQLWQLQVTEGARYCFIPVSVQGSMIAHNQNNIVAAARLISAELVAKGRRPVDAIFFFENDESFLDCVGAIDRLWKSGKDIVGATYCYKDANLIRAMGVELDGSLIDWLSLYHREDFTEVVALPSGALFIRMHVFDKLDEEAFPFTDDNGEQVSFTHAPIFQHDIHYGKRLVRTTDYVFCSRAIKAGFKIWLDAKLSLAIKHWGKFPYAFPDLSRANRQIATLQTIGDDLAKSADNPETPPELAQTHRIMAEDVHTVVADIVRRMRLFDERVTEAKQA